MLEKNKVKEKKVKGESHGKSLQEDDIKGKWLFQDYRRFPCS